jgi:hypothetical protein
MIARAQYLLLAIVVAGNRQYCRETPIILSTVPTRHKPNAQYWRIYPNVSANGGASAVPGKMLWAFKREY